MILLAATKDKNPSNLGFIISGCVCVFWKNDGNSTKTWPKTDQKHHNTQNPEVSKKVRVKRN